MKGSLQIRQQVLKQDSRRGIAVYLQLAGEKDRIRVYLAEEEFGKDLYLAAHRDVGGCPYMRDDLYVVVFDDEVKAFLYIGRLKEEDLAVEPLELARELRIFCYNVRDKDPGAERLHP